MKQIYQQIEDGYRGKRKGLPYTRYISLNLGKPCSVFFYKIGISPNWITFFAFILALAAGLSLFLVDSLVVTGFIVLILLQLSYALDCSDGQVARLADKVSPQGAWFDLVMDRITGFVLISALCYWFWQGGMFASMELFLAVSAFCLFANTVFSLATNLKGLIFPAASATVKSGLLRELVFSPSDTGVFYLVAAVSVFLQSWQVLLGYGIYKFLLLSAIIGSTLLAGKTSKKTKVLG